jgi:hypothetical protein
MWLIPYVSRTISTWAGVEPHVRSQIALVPHAKLAGFLNTSAMFVGNE